MDDRMNNIAILLSEGYVLSIVCLEAVLSIVCLEVVMICSE